MEKNVFDLAQEDTRLKVVSRRTTKGNGPEYAGPCPGCGGDDRFHVQPERKDGGAWMCRNCRPAEQYGWSDNIEYLRQFRSMSFTAAKNYLAGLVDTAIERADADMAQARLWTSEGKAGLDYLLSRGLTEETIHKAQLGYAVYRGIPSLVIPWYANGVYWRINLRDIRTDVPIEQRYRNIPGSSQAGLYMGDSLKLRRPTFLVEGEIDALSIAQVAGPLVAVVATGSTSGSRTAKWVTRLASVPSVLVAFDNEPKGHTAAKFWLNVLEHNAIRYKPIICKDVNAMLVADRELLAVWINAALDLLSEQDQDTSSQPTQETPALVCSKCGIDLATVDTGAYDENEVAYCNFDQDTLQAYCSRQSWTHERFMSIVNQLAGVFGPDCKITPVTPGYTLKQHVAMLQEQEKENEKRAREARRHNRAG